MTRETDSLIAYHAVMGAPGQVTDLNTPGVHAATSAHYASGTCAKPTQALDTSTGCIGCAVDFAFVPSQSMSHGLLDIFNAFGRIESMLWELFYEGAPYWIKNGSRVAKTTFPVALRNQHRNHVHVAIRPGAIIPISQPAPAPQPQESDMPAYADKYDWPDGSSVKVYPDGAVYCYGAKSWGSMFDLDPKYKQTFEQARSIRPVNPADSQAGYRVGDKTEWTFDKSVSQYFKK